MSFGGEKVCEERSLGALRGVLEVLWDLLKLVLLLLKKSEGLVEYRSNGATAHLKTDIFATRVVNICVS